jgi:hypothetical protein
VSDYGVIPPRIRNRGGRFHGGLLARYEALSYVGDWRDAFCQSTALDVRVCNINNLVDYGTCLLAIRKYDLVIVLHSAAGDSMAILRRTANRLRKRRGKLIVFIGNEYDLMAEKMAFLRATEAEYVCSQLPVASARWLYAECTGTEVLAMPHGLNPSVYHPPKSDDRPIDLGFIGAIYSYFLGDVERTRFLHEIQAAGTCHGLMCDVREGTVPGSEWAAFLMKSKGCIGAESGTYYLDRRGELIRRAKAFLQKNPHATFEEVYEHFFERVTVEHVSGKCISSRHFEAIGTKTCQVLLEGEYNGILESGKHYIGVKKDLSNIDDAIERFKDDAYRREIAARAYELVMSEHTYTHRVQALLRATGVD